jgi:hypothetical protein
MPRYGKALREAEAFLAECRLDALALYAGRGRRFAGLRTRVVQALWAESVRRWSRDVFDFEAKALWEDLGAELALRGEPEPAERVRAEWRVAWSRIEAILAAPEKRRRLAAAVGRERASLRTAFAHARLRLH